MTPTVEDWRTLKYFHSDRSAESWCDWEEFKAYLQTNDEELYHAYMTWKAAEKGFTNLVKARVDNAEDENEDD